MIFQRKLEKDARAMGAAYFGIADLHLCYNGVITPYEQELTSKFPFAISVGVPLSNALVDSIAGQSDPFALQNYRYYCFEMLNHLLNTIILKLSSSIMQSGYLALTVPPGKTLDNENHYGLFSNKMAASLAGLGWVGKSCLLITPDRGPRVRWGTILTDMSLTPGKPMQGQNCGECRICVKACPAGAFTGRPFTPSEPRDKRMDPKKCYYHIHEEQKRNTGVEACGLCVYICPFGRRTDTKQ